MAQVEQIKAEISQIVNRRLNLIHGEYFNLQEETNGMTNELFDTFVNFLQAEPVSEDLKEACEQLAENARKHKAETLSPFFSPTDYKQGVIDGANWQKEQDQKTIELAEDHAMLAGMEKMKKEMLKDAVEGEVHKMDNIAYIKETSQNVIQEALKDFADGDKVKLIIVKKE